MKFPNRIPGTPLVLLVAALAAVAPVRAQPVELLGLDTYIEQAIGAWEVPGLAIAVVRNDSVIYARGYGERRVGSGEPVDEHTLFAIASTTKAMTVAVLGMLRDDGALDWDDRVTAHLPGFELADPHVTRQVTIRDLVTHRTGVARHDNLWIASPFDRAEIVYRARHLTQAAGFRQGYTYNNLMYMVAGGVAAAAAGVPWDDLMESRLFGPLRMNRTTTRTSVVDTRATVATAHIRYGGELLPMARRNYDALGPAGSAWSSALDMAQWMRFQLSRGSYGRRRLLERESLDEMWEPQVVLGIGPTDRRRFPDRSFAAYGLGWRLHDYAGRKVVQHTGTVNYMRTQVGMIPDERIGVVILTNRTGATLHTALMYYVFDALLGRPTTDWSRAYRADFTPGSSSSSGPSEASRVRGTRPSLALAEYAATYTDALYGDVRIRFEDGRLVLDYSPDYVADLEHWHHDTFLVRWRSAGFGTTTVTFRTDAQGRARGLQLTGFATFTR
jgi:CubicO group peptidase (beta-lactamase class C family)